MLWIYALYALAALAAYSALAYAVGGDRRQVLPALAVAVMAMAATLAI